MRYHNLDLVIRREGGWGRYSVWADSQLEGTAEGILELDPRDPGLRERLRRLEARDTDRDFLVGLGVDWFGRLLPGEVGLLFGQSLTRVAGDDNEGIRLRLRIDPPEIAALPWELLYSQDQGCFLGTWIKSPIVRYLDIRRSLRGLETRLPLRILAVVPELPAPFAQLDSAAEEANLERALAELGSGVELHVLKGEGGVTYERLGEALRREQFHCLHFVGHGEFEQGRGSLLLGSEGGGVDPVDEERLAALLRNHESLKLIVLNSCETARTSASEPLVGVAQRLVAVGAPAVVAMQYRVLDQAAVVFARHFYGALFDSRERGHVDCATCFARQMLDAGFASQRELAAPVLFLRAPQGLLFNLVSGRLLADIPFSRAAADRSRAAQQTHEHNLALLHAPEAPAEDLEIAEEIREEEDQYARLRGRIRLRNALGLIALCTFLVVFAASWVRLFDLLTLDTRIESAVALVGDRIADKTLHKDIRLVAIDGASVEALGELGKAGRRQDAALVERLSRAGARVVVLDFHYPSARPGEDEDFAAAIDAAAARGTAVVLGYRALEGGAPDISPRLARSQALLGLVCYGKKLGFATTMPLAVQAGAARPPAGAAGLQTALSLQAVRAARGLGPVSVDWRTRELVASSPSGGDLTRLPFSLTDPVDRAQKECLAIEEGSRVAALLADLTPVRRLRGEATRESFARVLSADDSQLRDLAGSIVVLGSEQPTETFGVYGGLAERYGYELHVDAINSLLKGRAIRPASPPWQAALMVALGLIGAFLRTWVPARPRGRRALALVGVSALYLVLTVLLYVGRAVLINPLYPLCALWLADAAAGKVENSWFPRLVAIGANGRSK